MTTLTLEAGAINSKRKPDALPQRRAQPVDLALGRTLQEIIEAALVRTRNAAVEVLVEGV
jgi:hypothetical protein